MEMSDKLHASAYLPPGKEPLVPIGQQGGWVPEPDIPLCVCGKSKGFNRNKNLHEINIDIARQKKIELSVS
jgi:hypothetical protein